MNVDDGIRRLRARGFLFHAVRDEHGDIRVLVGAYGWPDCYDRLHIWAENDAIAARALPTERGADEIVWSYQNGALSTIQALLELPNPNDPGAPRLAHRPPASLWLPPTATKV